MTNTQAAKLLTSNKQKTQGGGGPGKSPMSALAQEQGVSGAQYKIKKFIDDIYQKEMKYRYHK